MADLTPHDHLFRHVFSDPEQAASFLREAVPAGLGELVDWDSLERLPDSFVDELLQPRQSDIIYRVQMVGGIDGLVYVLFEHQSRSDRWMAWRMLRYIVRIWDQWLRDHPDARRLPLVMPVVLFQGGELWTAPEDLHHLIDWPLGSDRELWQYGPSLRYHLISLSHVPDQELTGHALARLTLLLLKYARRGDLLDKLPRWRDTFVAVLQAPRGLQALEVLLRYLIEASPDDQDLMGEIEALVSDTFDADTAEVYMSGANYYRRQGHAEGREAGLEEGRQEGREEGRQSERRAMLLRILTHRFGTLPEDARAAIEHADADTLALWVERAFADSSLDEVMR